MHTQSKTPTPQATHPTEILPFAPDITDEKTIWTGTSSQIVNLGTYILCTLTSWLILPIFLAIWAYLEIADRRYELTSERLRIYSGVLSRRIDDMELYRVKDTCFVEPFFDRLFGLGNVELHTSDPSTPVITINAVKHARELREKIRHAVEAARERKGVKEIDQYSFNPIKLVQH